MAESMSVEAILSAVDENFTKTMESAVDSLSKVVQANQQASGGMVKSGIAMGASAATIAFALGTIKNSIGEVIAGLNESSATWKTFEGNMAYIGKSSTQISKVRSELTKYAQQTIYSASDMATTYSQLAAVGIKNTTKLVKGFGGLASAAEDPKQAMKTLSQQATQMASKPMVQWEDFKLMLEQTPAGIAAVAKSMHMSTSQLVADVQNGNVKTQDFFDAIAKVGTNKAFTQMSTEYKTLGQAMDGLVETITTKLQPAFDALSGVGIGAISGIINAIDNGGPAIEIITGLVIALTTFVGVLTAVGIALKLAALAESAFNTVMAVNPAIAIIAGIIALVATLGYFFTSTEIGKAIWKDFSQSLISTWNQIKSVATDVWGSISTVVDNALKAVSPYITAMANGFKSLISTIGELTSVGNLIAGVLTKIGLSALGISGPFGLAVSAILSFVAAWLQTGQLNADGFNQVIAQTASGITNMANMVAANLPAIVSTIVNVITNLATAIANAMPTIMASAIQILAALTSAIVAALPMLITAGLQIIVALVNAIVTLLPTLIQAGAQILAALVGAIIQNLPQIISAAVQIITTLIAGLISALPELVIAAIQIIIALAAAIITNLPRIIAAGVKILLALIKGILQMLGALLQAMGKIAKAIIDSVAHINLMSAGKAIMDSFLRGLRSAWEAVKRFVGKIAGWIKRHKGPISYDRKLLIPAGQAIMQGLNAGLTDGFGAVQDNVSTMAGRIQSLVANTQNGYAAGLSNLNSSMTSTIAGTMTIENNAQQNRIAQLLEVIANKDTTMVMDSGALVGATAGAYDRNLGQNVALNGRWS